MPAGGSAEISSGRMRCGDARCSARAGVFPPQPGLSVKRAPSAFLWHYRQGDSGPAAAKEYPAAAQPRRRARGGALRGRPKRLRVIRAPGAPEPQGRARSAAAQAPGPAPGGFAAVASGRAKSAGVRRRRAGKEEGAWRGAGRSTGGGRRGVTGWKEGEDQGRDTAEGKASDPTPTHRGLSKAEALLGQCRVTLDRRSFLSNDGPAAEVSGAARRTRARAGQTQLGTPGGDLRTSVGELRLGHRRPLGAPSAEVRGGAR